MKIKKNNIFGFVSLFFTILGIICLLISLTLFAPCMYNKCIFSDNLGDFDLYYGVPIRFIINLFFLLGMISFFIRLIFYKKTPKSFIKATEEKEKTFFRFLENNKITKIIVIIIGSALFCFLLLGLKLLFK